MTKSTAPFCPACGRNQLRAVTVRNAYSRFADVYICANCGVREAFEQFFWKERAYALDLGSKIKKEFV